jgi:hypothetical protein
MPLLEELFAHVWDRIEANVEAAKRPETAPADCTAPAGTYESHLERFRVSQYLEGSLEAAEEAGAEQISSLLRQAKNLLVWSQEETYIAAKLGSHFMENYVTGILTGPEGNLARDAPCSGFVLLGPDTEYPQHSHAPREVYLVLTPGVEWRLDGTHWFSVDPGQVIYHSPWQGHAIRTHATPMLAFAAWLDDGDRRAISI